MQGLMLVLSIGAKWHESDKKLKHAINKPHHQTTTDIVLLNCPKENIYRDTRQSLKLFLLFFYLCVLCFILLFSVCLILVQDMKHFVELKKYFYERNPPFSSIKTKQNNPPKNILKNRLCEKEHLEWQTSQSSCQNQFNLRGKAYMPLHPLCICSSLYNVCLEVLGQANGGLRKQAAPDQKYDEV